MMSSMAVAALDAGFSALLGDCSGCGGTTTLLSGLALAKTRFGGLGLGVDLASVKVNHLAQRYDRAKVMRRTDDMP